MSEQGLSEKAAGKIGRDMARSYMASLIREEVEIPTLEWALEEVMAVSRAPFGGRAGSILRARISELRRVSGKRERE